MKQHIITLNDRINNNDILLNSQHKTFRTSIDAYDQFGNILFSKMQNNVVVGGSIFVLEKLFNIRSAIQVDDLNTIMGINKFNPDRINEVVTLPKDYFICLWGAGIGGCGDSIGSVRSVDFYEREIGSKGNHYEMIPFRLTQNELSENDKSRYWFKRRIVDSENGEAYLGYYLKSFDYAPEIKAYFDDGNNGSEGTPIGNDVYDTVVASNIVVFAEVKLSITLTDFREYFERVEGNSDRARVNTIALCAGFKTSSTDSETGTTDEDYSNVLMVTKLNFNNIMLENNEIYFRYRIYTN